MPTREVRFGVGSSQGPGHRYWVLRASSKRRDVYILGNGTGGLFGASLHEDPNYWHWKVHRPGQAPMYLDWPRPDAKYAGCTRALEITAHHSVASAGEPARSSKPIIWYRPKGDNVRVHFDVFLEPSGVNPAIWPGWRSMGTELVGRCELSDGTTAVVVDRETPHEETTITIPNFDPEAASEMLRRQDRQGSWMILMGQNDDGSAWWMEGPVGQNPGAMQADTGA